MFVRFLFINYFFVITRIKSGLVTRKILIIDWSALIVDKISDWLAAL